MKLEFISPNEQKTISLGKSLLSKYPDFSNICLFGELGSGKTRLVQGLGQSLGLTRIKSPTYVFRHDYTLSKDTKSSKQLITGSATNFQAFSHFDLYRITNYDDTLSLDLESLVNNPYHLVVIEWADRLQEFLPSSRLEIHFKNLGGNRRLLTFQSFPCNA